jgi:hypothetical protein
MQPIKPLLANYHGTYSNLAPDTARVVQHKMVLKGGSGQRLLNEIDCLETLAKPAKCGLMILKTAVAEGIGDIRGGAGDSVEWTPKARPAKKGQ